MRPLAPSQLLNLGLAILAAVLWMRPNFVAAEQFKGPALSSGYNTLGAALAKEFEPVRGNIVFSPLSVGSSLAMTLAGARGNTAIEIKRALNFPVSSTGIERANLELLRVLNGYAVTSDAPTCPPGLRWTGARCEAQVGHERFCPARSRREKDRCVSDPIKMPPSAKILVANAIALGSRGTTISLPYRELIKSHFAGEVFDAAGAQAVNNWVGQRTEGRIPKIIDRLDPDTAAVLLNAVYFKAQWANPFDVSATHDENFRLGSTERVKVPTMQRTGYYRSIASEDFRAVQLPYDIGGLAMVVVLPNLRGPDVVQPRALGAEEATRILSSIVKAREKRIALALPRFSAEFRNDELAQILQKVGITRAFDPKLADFGGMTGRTPREAPLHLQRILHLAVIDVTERGTEAAAATASEIRVISAPVEAEPEPFRVDRPFQFFIYDSTTNTVLFQGRISDPRRTPQLPVP